MGCMAEKVETIERNANSLTNFIVNVLFLLILRRCLAASARVALYSMTSLNQKGGKHKVRVIQAKNTGTGLKMKRFTCGMKLHQLSNMVFTSLIKYIF